MRISFKTIKFVWIPRIIIMAFIACFSMFSFDAFTGNAPLFEKLAEFLIHMIPSLVMILFLIVSWNHPVTAGYIFMVLGVVFTFYLDTYRQAATFFTVSLIPFLAGLTFLIPSFLRKRQPSYQELSQ